MNRKRVATVSISALLLVPMSQTLAKDAQQTSAATSLAVANHVAMGQAGSQAAAGEGIPTGLVEGANDAQVREYQALGKAIVSPDGRFFLYEWQKPFNWVRNTEGLPKTAANRMQTLIYKVETDYAPSESRYLFYPESAASFWLGTLSPDASRVSFYELDHDTGKVKLGVYDVVNGTTMDPKLTWFETGPPPDSGRLDEPPVWVTNNQLIYPAAGKPTVIRPGTGKAKLVRAFVLKDTTSFDMGGPTGTIGEAVECFDCAEVYEKGRAAQRQSVLKTAAPPSIGPETRLIAQSPNAEVAVYAKENHDLLSLLYEKTDSGSAGSEGVFENRRRGPDALEAKAESDADKKPTN
jgi:hypothetical protein